MKLIPFQSKHGKLISEWILDPVYKDYFITLDVLPTADDCANYPKWAGHTIMMIEDKDVIGMVSANNISYRSRTVDVGILIDKKYHKNGAGSEAMKLWISFLMNQMGFRKLVAKITDQKWLDALKEYGFKQEGILLRQHRIDGILKHEYILGYEGEL